MLSAFNKTSNRYVTGHVHFIEWSLKSVGGLRDVEEVIQRFSQFTRNIFGKKEHTGLESYIDLINTLSLNSLNEQT